MPIVLPKAPDGHQYEDLVGATLRANGYFTETRIVLRADGTEVLELDVVATPSGPAYADRTLFEAKRQTPSFPNVFKLYGQRMYLDIASACLVTSKQPDDTAATAFASKASEIAVRVCPYPVGASADTVGTVYNTLTEDERRKAVEVGWFQHIAKRLCFAAFVKQCKQDPEDALFSAARTYDRAVAASFFIKDPLARAEALYSAYFASPKLTGQMVARLASGDATTIWRDIANSDKYPWLQYLMLLETSGRIGILKNTLDDLVTRGGGPPPKKTIKLGALLEMDIHEHQLPARYRERAELLQKHKHALRLPYLFQVFVELCGGFLVLQDADELQFLEKLTGIPAEDIKPALEWYDDLFAPEEGSMFYTVKDKLWCMKMIPGFIRGCGAFLRLDITGAKGYEGYGPAGYAMTNWHNAAYRILEKELGK